MTMLLAILAGAAVAAVPADLEEPNPKAMSYAEIRAFNGKLPRSHPFYIRCVKSEAIGSLIKRNVSCRTNEQWDKADKIGNDDAREMIDQYRGGKNVNTSG